MTVVCNDKPQQLDNFTVQMDPNDSSLPELYKSTHLLCDAINLYFSGTDLPTDTQKTKKESPIGIRLLYNRSAFCMIDDDYISCMYIKKEELVKLIENTERGSQGKSGKEATLQ